MKETLIHTFTSFLKAISHFAMLPTRNFEISLGILIFANLKVTSRIKMQTWRLINVRFDFSCVF